MIDVKLNRTIILFDESDLKKLLDTDVIDAPEHNMLFLLADPKRR